MFSPRYRHVLLALLVALPIAAVLLEVSFFNFRTPDAQRQQAKANIRVSAVQENQDRILLEVERDLKLANEQFSATKEEKITALEEKKKASKKAKKAKGVAKKASKGEPNIAEKKEKVASVSFKDEIHTLLLEEVAQLAYNSEQPWKELIRVAIAQWNFGWKEEAQDTFDIAADLAVDPDQPLSGSKALADVVRGLLRSKLMYRAIDTVERIPESQVKDEARAEIVVALSRRGREQDLYAAKKIASNLTDEKAKHRALIKIAEIQAYHHGAKAGLSSLEEISDLKQRSQGMYSVLMSRIKKQDFDSARDVVELIPDDAVRNSSLAQLAMTHARRHEFAKALDLSHLLSNQKQFDRATQQIALAQVKAGFGNQAITTAHQIDDDFTKARAFEQILRVEARSGRVRNALKLSGLVGDDAVKERAFGDIASEVTAKIGARSGRKIAQLTRQPKERDRALRMVAITSSKKGDSKQAVETAQQIRQPVERLYALASIADNEQRKGLGDLALSTLKKEESLIQQVELKNMAYLNRPISMAYAANGEDSRAIAVLDRLSNINQRDQAYKDLARRFGEQQKLERGVETIERISNERLRKQATSDFISALAKRTPPEKAIDASKQLMTIEDKVDFLIKVLDRI